MLIKCCYIWQPLQRYCKSTYFFWSYNPVRSRNFIFLHGEVSNEVARRGFYTWRKWHFEKTNSVNLLIKFSEFGHQFQWICLKRVSLLEPITSFSDTLTGHSQIPLTHIRHSFHIHPTSSLLPCPAATDVFFTNKLLVEKLGKQILFSYICKQQVL